MLQPRQPALTIISQSATAFFVLERYAEMLSADDVDRLQQFLSASADAQRLLARLLTRRTVFSAPLELWGLIPG